MGQLGIRVLQSGKRPGRSFAYMDTEALLGTIIEYREQTSKTRAACLNIFVASATCAVAS
jgi:hypothetical protein